MSNDRPEDVPRRLAELEATVSGLTQELVEANERLRQLEASLDDAADPEPREPNVDPDADDEDPTETDDIIIA